ncbi:MAG TPA: hypothetical protein VFX49_23125, partial [Chloroflexota bacterium]|nr:hypothetical protein [Chloroflexota bacterium]
REARRQRVAIGLLGHKTEAEIAKELSELPAGERPADCSVATVRRDAAAIREEWARERKERGARLLDGDLERFARIEGALLPACLTGDKAAIDRWLRLQAARAERVAAEGAGAKGAAGAGGMAVEVRVRYVDDWRAVRGAASGVGVVEVEGADFRDRPPGAGLPVLVEQPSEEGRGYDGDAGHVLSEVDGAPG